MKLNIIFPLVLLYILPLVLNFQATQGKKTLLLHTLQHINSSTSTSPWLTRLNNNRRPPPGCWRRPWICSQGQPPTAGRRLCCRNVCVDVTSDINNCGLCGIRCRFTRQCCRGRCVNTNRNPFHCGRCDNRCTFPIRCRFGMCGYAQPFPPRRPFPPVPRPPKRRPPPAG